MNWDGDTRTVLIADPGSSQGSSSNNSASNTGITAVNPTPAQQQQVPQSTQNQPAPTDVDSKLRSASNYPSIGGVTTDDYYQYAKMMYDAGMQTVDGDKIQLCFPQNLPSDVYLTAKVMNGHSGVATYGGSMEIPPYLELDRQADKWGATVTLTKGSGEGAVFLASYSYASYDKSLTVGKVSMGYVNN